MIGWLVEPYRFGFMRDAGLVALVIGLVAPAVGVWVALRRLTYLGDAMSHGTLGGVAVAVLLGIDPVLGALVAAATIAAGIALLRRRPLIASDAAIGISSVTLFALGVLLISRGGFGVEVSHFLFGQLIAIGRTEMALILVLGIAVLVVLAGFFRDLELTTLDAVHARQVGVRVELVDAVVLGLVSLTVVICLRSVGLLMSVAMVVVPANAARMVAASTVAMTGWAMVFGTIASVGGLTASYHLASAPGATITLSAVGVLVAVLLGSRLHTAIRPHPAPAIAWDAASGTVRS